MKSIRFKTNLKSADCLETVKPHLQKVSGLMDWSIDLSDPDRPLTAQVSCDDMTAAVEEAIRMAGYEATQLDQKNDIGY